MSTTGCSPTGASEYLREPMSASDCLRVVGAHEYLRTFAKTYERSRVAIGTHECLRVLTSSSESP